MTRRTAPTLVALAASAALSGSALLATATPAGASKATTVTVIETDFHMAFSTTNFKAGNYTFVIKNRSGTVHGLTVTGPGLGKNASVPIINPGKTARLTVTFKKGNYDLFCPVPGHKALGMNMNVRISGSGSSPSASHTSTSGSGSSSAGSGGAAF